MSAQTEMRPELATIIRARYGDQSVSTTALVLPTEEVLKEYGRHGLVSMQLNLERNPHLVVIDTARFMLLRHAWIRNRHPESLRLIIASGNQQVSQETLRTGTYDQRVEGLELMIHYSHNFGRGTPYKAELKPLW